MSRFQTPGYSALQITLHWLIAALVAYQLIFGEAMEEMFDAVTEGEPIPADAAAGGTAHLWVGVAVLVLTALRLVVRVRQGVPPEPHTIGPMVRTIARASHHLFYLLLVLTPVTGLLAYYVWPDLADVHTLAKPAFIVLIAVHAAAAVWHQFFLKDGTLMRILKPGS